MRKTMQKEVQHTEVTYVEVVVNDGVPSMTEPKTVNILGKLTEPKAINKINRLSLEKGKVPNQVIITELTPYKVKYEMAVDDFIKYADIAE